MKIRKLTASFGKLENESLSFHEGLNVIYAPNESGKTTWCAFIQAMLYGVDSSQRARAGFLPDKLRYAPWSGAPMEGTMELTADRCDITLTRSSRAKNAPMKEFSATYTGTNTPVEGLTEANAGELLTGVSRDVFRRTAFIAQGTMAVKGSPELEKRISSIVSTGEEQTSYTEADERLRAWQRKRRFNRRGQLPELEGRMDEAQRQLDEIASSQSESQKLEEELEESRRKCAQLEQAVMDSRRRQRKDALDRLNSGRGALRQVSAEHDSAMAELSQAREELRQSPFGDQNPEQLEKQVRGDLERLRELAQPRKGSRVLLPMLLCFLLAATLAALYTYYELIPLIVAAGVFCLAALVLLMLWSRGQRLKQDAEEERRLLLKKYHSSSPREIQNALKDFQARYNAVLEAETWEEERRQAFEAQQRAQSDLEESALQELDFSVGDTEAARLGRSLAAERAVAERLSQRIAALNGRVSSFGDPMILASELGCMREEYEQLQAEFDALSLAIDTLRQADQEIQSRFSPQLGRLASEYMSAVTGGRYEDVLINRDFSARTRTRDDAIARDSEYLSAGTLDLMYLAVRLAVCELAMPDGEPCPLILDDALVNLDEDRLDQAMALLKKIAQERQVILFTCRPVN